MTLDGLRMAKHQMFFTSAKAERELGYAAVLSRRACAMRFSLVPREGLLAMTLELVVAILAFAIWVYLLLFRGGFWLARDSDDA